MPFICGLKPFLPVVTQSDSRRHEKSYAFPEARFFRKGVMWAASRGPI